MPLVAYKNLPSFDKLRDEGRLVLEPGRAQAQDIREIHVGLLNMMPDKALLATERQFFRLVGESNQIAQFYLHPFTLSALPRSAETQAYIDEYYETFESIKESGLDALIITGANVVQPQLELEDFWQPLQEVMAWAWENVTSTLCSCLATHAYMQFTHGQKRSAAEKKIWGVYPHRVIDRHHPLVRGMNTVFDVPHSRNNRISAKQFSDSGMPILVWSEEAGVHMATSPDGFRVVCLQGHPEYDLVSLLKEYQRDLGLYHAGELAKEPPYPENYFSAEAAQALVDGVDGDALYDLLENSWCDSARSVLANWIGQVYQITNVDRTKQFMESVDPNDPLGLKG